MGIIVDWFVWIPLLFAITDNVMVVGDSLTLARPGYMVYVDPSADRLICYHLADCLFDWPDGRYDLIIVELGTHAVAGCDHLPAQNMTVFVQRYGAILERAQQSARSVVVVNIPALGWEDDEGDVRAQAYNEIIAKIAAGYDIPVADVYSVTVDCPDCIGDDGFHPSERGYQRIGERVAEVVASCKR